MSAPNAVNNAEPARITAGDSVAWTRAFADGVTTPVAGWTLSYYLQGPGQITFAAAADAAGLGYVVAVPAATTAGWTPGVYAFAAVAVHAADAQEITVARGTVSVLPNPRAAAAPSHAAKSLELIQAAIEGRIPRGLEETNIDGQMLSRIPLLQLYGLKEKYRREVLAEAAAARAALGLGRRGTIAVRFVRPS